MTQLMRQVSVSIGHLCPPATDMIVTTASAHPGQRLVHNASADGNRLPMQTIKESAGGAQSPLTPSSSISPRSDDTMSPNANNHQCLDSATPQSAPNTPPHRPSPSPGSPTEFLPNSHQPQPYSHSSPTAQLPLHQPHHFISRHPAHIVATASSPPLKQMPMHTTQLMQSGITLSSTTTSPPPPTKTSFCIEALLSKGQRGAADERVAVVSQHQHPSLAPSNEQGAHHHDHRMMSAELAQRFMMRGEREQQHQGPPTDDEDMRYADEGDYSPSPDEDGSR